MQIFDCRCFCDRLEAEIRVIVEAAVPGGAVEDAYPRPAEGTFPVEVLLLDERPVVPALPPFLVKRRAENGKKVELAVRLLSSDLSPGGTWKAVFQYSEEE